MIGKYHPLHLYDPLQDALRQKVTSVCYFHGYYDSNRDGWECPTCKSVYKEALANEMTERAAMWEMEP